MISSIPYITSYTFRGECAYALMQMDDTTHIKNKKSKPLDEIIEGDCIYVVTEQIPLFFHTIHPKINCKYRLISGRSDILVNNSYHKFIDEKIISWHSVNSVSDIIKQIPLGLANRNWGYDGFPQGNTTYFDDVRNENIDVTSDILMSFQKHTNLNERQKCFDYFKGYDFVNHREYTNENRKNHSFFKDYLRQIKGHKFTICPWGNGVDCHRNYEVWYMGGIPIIKKHKALEMLYDLPAWWIDDWSDVTEDKIDVKYKEIKTSKWNLEKLNHNYWLRKIKNYDSIT